MDRKQRMIGEIEEEVRSTVGYTGRARLRTGVLEAMTAVPREEFVPPNLREQAYENVPLPIGQGQTISQPFIVALMTDLLEPEPGHRILEVGTGCGYQAAVLAELVQEVYSVEAIPGLGEAARERLKRLGYGNVSVRVADGNRGWPEAAPFDGIVVTAGAREVPVALVEQLAPGGRLVLPLEGPDAGQDIQVVTKDSEGARTSQPILPVAFVPLIHPGVPG
ncbi:protein-L-isoaspartate(D-aspartate) O-methyltransferase [Thiohalorhabdus methylotrophus]|uniref:Protein-L-isoaspartate O-methyltransferase n=1 Tax=Thiohalorhabdus methylotrophus TaxID=3242694 RepID=A0ABV4TWV9_9GAMM